MPGPGGSQQPIDIVVDTCLCSDIEKNFKSYQGILKIFESVPQAIFGHVNCPPGGEVDLLPTESEGDQHWRAPCRVPTARCSKCPLENVLGGWSRLHLYRNVGSH